MTTPKAPALCFLCAHYKSGLDPTNPHDHPTCLAFPDRIPERIFLGGFDHRDPLYNEPITFRPAQGVTATDVGEWEQEILEIEKRDLFALLDAVGASGECADTDVMWSSPATDHDGLTEALFLERIAQGLGTRRKPPSRT
jgi:hypothetical protein